MRQLFAKGAESEEQDLVSKYQVVSPTERRIDDYCTGKLCMCVVIIV